MSKILTAMRKSGLDITDVDQRLQMIDRENLYPLPGPDQNGEFEQLANSLINIHGGHGGQVVVFSSTYSGEGNSYVSYNCARYLTLLLNKKVAWVDANFSHPQPKLVNSDLNLKGILAAPETFPQLDKESGLVLFGNGNANIKTMDALKGPSYSQFINSMRDNFFFTVIDASPIMNSVEVAPLAQGTMGLVLVVESQRLKYEVIQHGIEKMRKQDVNVLGTVLNKRSFQLPDFLYRRL